jgi:hypothetical protein
MTSTTIIMTKVIGSNNAEWATEMALLLAPKQVYGIIKGYGNKPEEPAANAIATGKAAFKDWMNCHGVARLNILLGMELRMQVEYMVVDDAKTLWEKPVSAYQSTLKLNIFELMEDVWCIKLQDCRDFDNYESRIDGYVQDYNLWAGPMTNDTDTADTNANAKIIAMMSPHEHIFYLLPGIPTYNKWKVFLDLMIDKNTTKSAMPKEIITKLVEKEAAIKRENGLSPDALLYAK